MRHIYTIILAACCLLTIGCNRYYYKPNAVNAPLFTKGGQAHVNASFSSSIFDNSTFYDLQAAVSPINHVGIIANYAGYNYNPGYIEPLTGDVPANAYLAEVGIGTYYAIGGKKIKMVTDLYAGYGIGQLRSDIDLDATRIFVQPGFGVRAPWFDAVFTPRLSFLNYSNLDANGLDSFYLNANRLVDLNSNERIDGKTHFFFEPTITLRGGYKFAKMQVQLVLARPFTYTPWDYSAGHISVGFYFTLEDLIEHIKENKAD